MRLLIDFFPIALFFVAYKWHGIYAATAVLSGTMPINEVGNAG